MNQNPKERTLERVIKAARKYDAVQDLEYGANTRLAEDMRLDSLGVVELVLAIEDEFVQDNLPGIPDEALESIKTLGDIAAAVDALLHPPAAKA